MQEQDLFQGYEIKNWEFSPRIYKILAVSAIFNLLALLIFAQTNLLTTKGCDSPLVGGVCQVLDTLYVSGTTITANSGYVDGDYTKTELEDAEIIWVNRDEEFKYPEGYFAISNPTQINAPYEIPTNPNDPFPVIPGIPNPTTGGTTPLLNQPPVLPENNPNAVTGNLPDSPFTFENNPTVPKPGKIRSPRPQKNPKINEKSPTVLPDFTANANKNPTTDPAKTPNGDKVEEIVINKKPMKDFASVVKTKYDKKEIDLSQNFKVVAEGVLTKDGKLDVAVDNKTNQPKSRILVKEGNPEMVEVVAQAISAIGDSGWLGYLRTQSIEKINFTVVQDNDNLQVIITSDLPTPERANTVTSGLNGVIQAAFFADQNNIKKLGEDEKTLLKSATVTVNPDNKKQFVFNVVLPKATALDMITRKLNEPPDPTEPKPSGNTGQFKDNKQITAK